MTTINYKEGTRIIEGLNMQREEILTWIDYALDNKDRESLKKWSRELERIEKEYDETWEAIWRH